jgi:hypothetical protein
VRRINQGWDKFDRRGRGQRAKAIIDLTWKNSKSRSCWRHESRNKAFMCEAHSGYKSSIDLRILRQAGRQAGKGALPERNADWRTSSSRIWRWRNEGCWCSPEMALESPQLLALQTHFHPLLRRNAWKQQQQQRSIRHQAQHYNQALSRWNTPTRQTPVRQSPPKRNSYLAQHLQDTMHQWIHLRNHLPIDLPSPSAQSKTKHITESRGDSKDHSPDLGLT